MRYLPALAFAACAPAPDHEATTGEFTALTYNVHGLPEFITGDDTAGRIAQIAPLLADYPVIGLQEAFRDDDLATLTAGAPDTTAAAFTDPVDNTRAYGSGLAVFAALPGAGTYTEHFTDCFGTVDAASDCLASKGILAVRLLVGAGLVDVYSIHLEAGGSDDDAAARTAQVEQIVAAMNGWSAGNAIIFLGDTNVDIDDARERPQLERLLSGAGLEDACERLQCPEPNHIDRILFRSGEALALDAVDWRVAPEFVDASGAPLSDHPAIAGTFAWVAP